MVFSTPSCKKADPATSTPLTLLLRPFPSPPTLNFALLRPLRSVVASLWLGMAALFFSTWVPTVRAEVPELTSFEVTRTDEGVLLNFAVRFELPRGVEDALLKGVPIYFVAEAEVMRDRWYWFDRRVGKATRTWRLAYQPLTRKYRLTLGGLNQSFDSLEDALYAARRATAWKIAEPGQFEDGARHYVEFAYRLDTNLLPRPLQIGLSGQPDWSLLVTKVQRFN
jgi:hypothetical protein